MPSSSRCYRCGCYGCRWLRSTDFTVRSSTKKTALPCFQSCRHDTMVMGLSSLLTAWIRGQSRLGRCWGGSRCFQVQPVVGLDFFDCARVNSISIISGGWCFACRISHPSKIPELRCDFQEAHIRRKIFPRGTKTQLYDFSWQSEHTSLCLGEPQTNMSNVIHTSLLLLSISCFEDRLYDYPAYWDYEWKRGKAALTTGRNTRDGIVDVACTWEGQWRWERMGVKD